MSVFFLSEAVHHVGVNVCGSVPPPIGELTCSNVSETKRQCPRAKHCGADYGRDLRPHSVQEPPHREGCALLSAVPSEVSKGQFRESYLSWNGEPKNGFRYGQVVTYS